jgi:hypothetical protein
MRFPINTKYEVTLYEKSEKITCVNIRKAQNFLKKKNKIRSLKCVL